MVPGVLLEPYMSQGDQGVAETLIVSKGLTTNIYPASSAGVAINRTGTAAQWDFSFYGFTYFTSTLHAPVFTNSQDLTFKLYT